MLERGTDFNESARLLTPEEVAEISARYDRNIFQGGRKQVLEEGLVSGDLRKLINSSQYSLDINYELPDEALRAIEGKILKPFRRLLSELGVPRRLIFPKSWQHMTLVTPIGSATPQEERPIDVRHRWEATPYMRAVREALAQSHPVEITFCRLGLTTGNPQRPSGILLGGTPATDEVEQTRIRVKEALDAKGLYHTIRNIPDIYHLVLWRCTDPISQEGSKKVLELVENLNGQEIWRGTINEVMFGSGGWLMGRHNTQVYQVFPLR